MSGERLALHIVNDLAELARVAERVDEFCAAYALPADFGFKFNIALEELLTNTISYGYVDTGRHEIALALTREGDDLIAELSDDARPFNPLEAAAPDLEASIEERRIGGLGVHLVKTLMDEVAYAYRDGRNIVTLRKRIAADPE